MCWVAQLGQPMFGFSQTDLPAQVLTVFDRASLHPSWPNSSPSTWQPLRQHESPVYQGPPCPRYLWHTPLCVPFHPFHVFRTSRLLKEYYVADEISLCIWCPCLDQSAGRKMTTPTMESLRCVCQKVMLSRLCIIVEFSICVQGRDSFLPRG